MPPSSPIVLRQDDLSSPAVQALVAEHLAGMAANSPAEHCHALALDALRQPDVTFWTAWIDGALCGCGALKVLDNTTGEIKSMRTRQAWLRQAVGQTLLSEIERTARAQGLQWLKLETGSGEAFEAALTLYRRNGFLPCEPFGDYRASAFNRFFAKRLNAPRPPERQEAASAPARSRPTAPY